MEKASQELKAKKDEVISVIWAYENSDTLYLDGVTSGSTDHPAKIDLLINGWMNSANSSQIRIKLEIIGMAMDQMANGRTDTGVIEWGAIRQEILRGNNHTDTLINLNLNTINEPQKIDTELAMAVFSGGMNVDLGIKGESNRITMENKTVVSISFLHLDPVLKMTLRSRPTDESPVPPALDDSSPLVITESGMSEEDNRAIQESFSKGAIVFLVRMGVALPEDALDIIKQTEGILPSVNWLLPGRRQPDPLPGQSSFQDMKPEHIKEGESVQIQLDPWPVQPLPPIPEPAVTIVNQPSQDEEQKSTPQNP